MQRRRNLVFCLAVICLIGIGGFVFGSSVLMPGGDGFGEYAVETDDAGGIADIDVDIDDDNSDEGPHQAVSSCVSDFEFLTRQAAVDILSTYFDVDVSIFGDDDMRVDITVGEFLQVLSQFGRFFTYHDGEFVYVIGDSDFMSVPEFNELVLMSGERLTQEQFCDVLSRLDASLEFLDRHDFVRDDNAYVELLDGYYGEFSEFYYDHPERAMYWLDNIFNNNLQSRFSNMFHEMAHEESACLSDGYVSKTCEGGQWRVIWSDEVSALHPYDMKSGKFVKLVRRDVPMALGVLDLDTLSRVVQNTRWFRTYIAADDAISNLFGIYGMAEEFCASVLDVRYEIISSMLGYKEFTDDDLRSYYFWMGAVCEYLNNLKDIDSDIYERVIGDDILMGLLRDAYFYINENIEVCRPAESSAWDSVALKNWFESDVVQNMIMELFG